MAIQEDLRSIAPDDPSGLSEFGEATPRMRVRKRDGSLDAIDLNKIVTRVERFADGLDAVQQAELINLVRQLREDLRLTLLVLTDDLAVAHHLGDDIGILHQGRLLELGNAETVLNRPEHDYTRRLVSCSV